MAETDFKIKFVPAEGSSCTIKRAVETTLKRSNCNVLTNTPARHLAACISDLETANNVDGVTKRIRLAHIDEDGTEIMITPSRISKKLQGIANGLPPARLVGPSATDKEATFIYDTTTLGQPDRTNTSNNHSKAHASFI